MPAVILGQQTYGGGHQTLYRLSRPLLDRAPDVRNVVVVERHDYRSILGGAAYETAYGSWKAIPHGSWVRCCQPLTERDSAFAEADIQEAEA